MCIRDRVYSYAFVGLMLDWIKDEMKQDPETLVNRFALVIQDDVSCALNRFRVDRGNSASCLLYTSRCV